MKQKAMTVSINNSVNNNQDAEQRMTSLEIAQLSGKPHNDVLKAIRKMEIGWAKVAQGNFSLGSYEDNNGQSRPTAIVTFMGATDAVSWCRVWSGRRRGGSLSWI